MDERSVWPRLPTTRAGYSVAVLLGFLAGSGLFWILCVLAVMEGWYRLLLFEDSEAAFFNEHSVLVGATCVVLTTATAILLYRHARDRVPGAPRP